MYDRTDIFYTKWLIVQVDMVTRLCVNSLKHLAGQMEKILLDPNVCHTICISYWGPVGVQINACLHPRLHVSEL